MLRSESIHMIREMALEGKSPYSIGKELGISKNTVRKYLDLSADGKQKYPDRGSKLDPYKPKIKEMMASGIFNCVVIFERIQELGYNGQISILKDYVRPFRPPKQLPAVRRYETEPGRQTQMDWGICRYGDDHGELHKVPCFVMILGHSRARYIEFTKRCDLFSLEHCILNAFEYYNGVTETILTDNMKTVTEGREGGKPIWNPGFLDFSNDIGFVPKVCRVRRPETKGKVERLVQYVKNNFLPGRVFTDIDDLNKQAVEWCNKVNAKPSYTTGRKPFEMMAEEKLKPLPDSCICDRYRYESRKVSNDAFVSYDGVRYGVPWQYCGRNVTVRSHSGNIEIYDGLVLIASHECEPHSGRAVSIEGQYQGLAERNGMVVIPAAHMTDAEVEKRPLSVYEDILEVCDGRI